jgi:hypothetical protein
MYGGSVGRWRREMEELDAICAGRWRGAQGAGDGTPVADEEYVSIVVGELEGTLAAQLAELRREVEGLESFVHAIADAVERLQREGFDAS